MCVNALYPGHLLLPKIHLIMFYVSLLEALAPKCLDGSLIVVQDRNQSGSVFLVGDYLKLVLPLSMNIIEY